MTMAYHIHWLKLERKSFSDLVGFLQSWLVLWLNQGMTMEYELFDVGRSKKNKEAQVRLDFL